MELKSIDTLVEDIQGLLVNGIEGLDPSIVEAFGSRMGTTFADRLVEERKEGTLRMSNIGKPCIRQLWYEVNKPDEKEQLDASVRLKFLYGDLLEELLLFLAELSGHTVEGRQDNLSIAGVSGHRDAVIDGVLCDVKSASSYSFAKFKKHLTPSDDSFGYLTQLQSYLHASQSDPKVTQRERGAFFVIDKVLGHVCLDFHDYIPFDWEKEYENRIRIVNGTIPNRTFFDIVEGKSGNRKLGIECSYCPFKFSCWPNLRVFNYSNGPVYLTRVVKTPNVVEIVNEDTLS